MSKVAIVTDSNSGITQSEAKEYGVTVMPMPFFINDQTYYEDIDLLCCRIMMRSCIFQCLPG